MVLTDFQKSLKLLAKEGHASLTDAEFAFLVEQHERQESKHMFRFALDSDKPGAIPFGVAQVVMTYADLFPILAELRAFEQAHSDSVVVLIDRGLGDPLGLATIADVEPFALNANESLVDWFERKTAAGLHYLTTYENRSNMAQVDADLNGTPFENRWQFVATLDGTLVIPGMPALVRPALVQCFSAAMLGIHADGSVIIEDGWHPEAQG